MILRLFALLFAALVVLSAQTSQPPTPATQQQAKTSGNAGSREPQPPTPPPKIAIDGPVIVVNQPDPAQTLFDNALQVLTLVFVAIATVAAIAAWRANRRSADAETQQANASAQQLEIATSARVYVEGVTAVNFQPGQEAVFFLRIANAGPVPAENVNVFIAIKHRRGGTTPIGAGNRVLIPANGHRDYDFRSSFLLPADLSAVENWDLKIEGTVTHGKKVEKYCYKYNPWTGQRPDGVPLFVPCDFDARRNVTVSVEGVSAIASVGTLIPSVTKEGESKDKPTNS